jgi:3-phosphoshikimate 1-carboxyvinyltransferase
MIFHKSGPLKGSVTVPGDKSISHRSVMFGALAEGVTEVTNFLQGADCLSTIRCFSQLGIEIDHNRSTDHIIIHGKGLHGLSKPMIFLMLATAEQRCASSPVFSADNPSIPF